MFPPLFETLNASSAVKAVLGSNPLRVYPFGMAPQNPTLPYAVFQTVAGSPENRLDCVPDMDGFVVQIDVYGDGGEGKKGATQARNAAKAIRDAIEPVAYVTAWRGEDRDRDTFNYRFSFDVSFLTSR